MRKYTMPAMVNMKGMVDDLVKEGEKMAKKLKAKKEKKQ